MKVLHTSDWHLGRSLYDKKRYEVFSSFLEWLLETIHREQVDILLISGDIFDTVTPTNQAQLLYYHFLNQVTRSHCRHVVIIAGNHDSPSFLDAPKDLLQSLNIHIVSQASKEIKNEVITLYDDNKPLAIICAIPYLRDKDIRLFESGETIDDKNKKLIKGIKNHYKNVCNLAKEKQSNLKKQHKKVPIITMGHLFTAGGKTLDNDGVRELYVGSIAHIGSDIFPPFVDYVALGHLHVPQVINQQEHIRYSGSPIPIGFSELSQDKQVVIVEFNDSKQHIYPIIIPSFQSLARITGDINNILSTIDNLKENKNSIWIEVEYTGDAMIANLHTVIEQAVQNSNIEVIRIKNKQLISKTIQKTKDAKELIDLTADDVFIRYLDTHEITDKDRPELINTYKAILNAVYDDDHNKN